MKRVLCLAVICVATVCASAKAAPPSECRNCGPKLAVASAPAQPQGNPWMFQRSYYSHEPIQNVRIGRAATGGPYYTRPTGGYVNAGWRWNRSTINVGGQVWDNTNVIESWVQTGGQF